MSRLGAVLMQYLVAHLDDTGILFCRVVFPSWWQALASKIDGLVWPSDEETARLLDNLAVSRGAGLQELDFSGRRLGALGVVRVSRVIETPGSFPVLRRLVLGGYRPDVPKSGSQVYHLDHAFDSFAEAVASPGALPCLEELEVCDCLLVEYCFEEMAKALSRPSTLPRLAVLRLRTAGLLPRAMTLLADTLRAPGALQQLAVLDLSGNKLLDAGVAVLAAALAHTGACPRLTTLTLRRTGLASPQVVALNAALTGVPAARGVQALAAVLAGALPCLTELDLMDNDVEPADYKMLAGVRPPGQPLRILVPESG
jgi:hypothetical protein